MKKFGNKYTKPWKMFENDIAAKATLESAAVSKRLIESPTFRHKLLLGSFDFGSLISMDFSTSGV